MHYIRTTAVFFLGFFACALVAGVEECKEVLQNMRNRWHYGYIMEIGTNPQILMTTSDARVALIAQAEEFPRDVAPAGRIMQQKLMELAESGPGGELIVEQGIRWKFISKYYRHLWRQVNC